MATDRIARSMAANSKQLYDNLVYLVEDLDVVDYSNVEYSYDGNGDLTGIVWKDGSNINVRTDTISYSSTQSTETIVQSISIVGGSSIVVTTVFDLEGNVLSINKVVT